jgi:ATP-binding cassette subfamily F protein 3
MRDATARMRAPRSPRIPLVLHFRNLTLARGARRLLEDVSLQIHPGWRIGVVGANGSGKSSLFALLAGELHPEAGDCTVPTNWRLASVAQETPALERKALDFVLDGDQELRTVESQIADAESSHDGTQLGEAHARYAAIDGYSAAARGASLLAGLGFANGDLERSVAEFSGGWRMRLNLARALAARAELLLLDEPTNHLDLDAIVWLERWLSTYRGTLLVVSHDRDFLDGCVTHIAHLEGTSLTLYTGNYSAFETQRAARLAVQQAMHEQQQREIAHIMEFVTRFRAKASKARQAQSRLKALDRLERVSAAHVDTAFDFEFPEPERAPDPLLTLEDARAGYGDRVVLDGLQLSLRPGSRIGLLGPNGAGKSTLVKTLVGDLPALGGRRVVGHGLRIGYFAQHQLEQLAPDDTPLGHFARSEPRTRETELRSWLGHFDFGGERADARVATFSGGEKSRLALALLVRARPNLVLLDEPTNHLDLEMRHALTRALTGYEGSVVLVSHDRTLLRTVCDRFLLVADGRAAEFDGDLDDYLAWLTARRASAADSLDPQRALQRETTRAERERAVAERQQRLARRRPLLREIARLEGEIATFERERQALETQLADAAFYTTTDSARVQAAVLRQAELTGLIGATEECWLAANAELDAIGEA